MNHQTQIVKQYKIWTFEVQADEFRDRQYKGYADKFYSNRAIMIEFLKNPDSEFFIDNGMALSIHSHKEAATMRTRYVVVASMNIEQHKTWEQRQFLEKLAT